MKTLMTLLVILALVFIFIWWPISFFINGWHHQTGQGEHTGYITAVEKSGIFWKTYTAYVKTDLSSSQEDRYCVMDEEVATYLMGLAKERKQATFSYIEYFESGLKYCAGESAIIVK